MSPLEILMEALRCAQSDFAVLGDAEGAHSGVVDSMVYRRAEPRIDLALALGEYCAEFSVTAEAGGCRMIARMLASGRFPRAAVVLEILALAELFRTTAGAMDKLAESAYAYEPSLLRRAAHGVVRGLVAEVQGQVTL